MTPPAKDMPADPSTVRALAETYSAEDIAGIRKVALDVRMEGGTTTRNYEGSSMTISIENAGQIIEDCNAALDYLKTSSTGADPDLVRSPVNSGVDFSFRRIQ